MKTIKYTGDFECTTVQPSALWQPGEAKDVSDEDAAVILTNELFQATTPEPVQIDDTIHFVPEQGVESDA